MPSCAKRKGRRYFRSAVARTEARGQAKSICVAERQLRLVQTYQLDRRPGESMADYQRLRWSKKQVGRVALPKRYTSIQQLGENAKTGAQNAELGGGWCRTAISIPPARATIRTQSSSWPWSAAILTRHVARGFNKLINGMLTEQIKAMGQSGVGRVLMAEWSTPVDCLARHQAAPNMLLLEIQRRTYEAEGNRADRPLFKPTEPGPNNQDLDDKSNTDLERHPIFSQAEIDDFRLIAPPVFKDLQTMQASGLPRGSPFRIQGRGDKNYWVQ
jgi:hypothetical protein